MKKLLVVFVLISVGCNSQSTKSAIDKIAMPLIDSFFNNIKAKDAHTALEQLLATNPNINLRDSATLNLSNSFSLINTMSGSYTGYRLLKKRGLEDDITIYSYLAKYEKKFYRFVFMFYNNGKVIRLYKFLFDDNIDVELEESLKFYAN